MSDQQNQPRPTISVMVSQAVSRFWAERARGRTVSVDELLETMPGTPEHEAVRMSVIQALSTQAGTFSGQPASGAAAGSSDEIAEVLKNGGLVPEIDGYDLVGCLGRGGMGAVYEGYQQSTGRRVAVKFMLDSGGASESARKRFEREVEVVARLQHHAIVSIIDSGVRQGRYFYAMEFVEGRPLDIALMPGQCEIRAALSIMARICDAVDYAHQHGVLHRDLKPGNILVDEQGQPHLLDFGLAKVFDPGTSDGGSHGELGLTVSGPGHLLGTVAYMSPEQALGRHDETSVRTDVYSLGVIAFELLTAKLPTGRQSSLHEALKGIIEAEPTALSAHRAGLSHDLDAVILKALQKNPDHRYATAGEFAADLRRVLAGEPVLARRISAAGRAWRWVRRNQAISGVTVAAMVTLAAVSTFLIAQVIHESRIAARERDLAQESIERLSDILASVDPNQSAGGTTVLQLLDAAAEDLDESPMKSDLAEVQIREVLGRVYRNLGQYDQARNHLEKALAIRERHAAGRDEPKLAEALHELAATLWWEGKFEEAERYYVRSLEIRRRLYPGDHPDVAESLTHLAACHLRLGRFESARAMYDEALVIRQRHFGVESEHVAASINNLAKCMLEADEFVQAETLHRRALAMIRRIRGDQYFATAAASQNLGECLLRRSVADEIKGDHDRALEAKLSARGAFAESLAIRRENYPDGHHLVAASMNGLARTELQLGNPEQAAELAQASFDEYQRTRRPGHPDLAQAWNTLGRVHLARGRYADAATALDNALAIAMKAQPPDESQIAQYEGELAMVLASIGELDEAEALLTSSFNTLRRLRGDDAIDTILAARRLIEFFELIKQPSRAETFRHIAQFD